VNIATTETDIEKTKTIYDRQNAKNRNLPNHSILVLLYKDLNINWLDNDAKRCPF